MGWGGKREGAGRKRVAPRPLVPHRPRQRFETPEAIFVTFRVTSTTCNMRRQRPFTVLKRVFKKARERFGTRILQFAVLGNHIHLAVEAPNTKTLSRAMKGLGVRIARNLNRLMERAGRVIDHRHHSSVIMTVKRAMKVLRYIRENYRKHFGEKDEWRTGCTIDPFSSWANVVELPAPATAVMMQADPFG